VHISAKWSDFIKHYYYYYYYHHHHHHHDYIVTLCSSGTFMEIWWLKNNGITTLTFRGHMASLVMWPFNSTLVDFLRVVNCDHASIWHRYGDMALQRHEHRHTDTHTQTDLSHNLLQCSLRSHLTEIIKLPHKRREPNIQSINSQQI